MLDDASVSLGGRGTETQLSIMTSVVEGALLSHCSVAAAFAAPESMPACSGPSAGLELGWSLLLFVKWWSSASVSPAFAMVGSVPAVSESPSWTLAACCVCCGSSTPLTATSSSEIGAFSSASSLTLSSNVCQYSLNRSQKWMNQARRLRRTRNIHGGALRGRSLVL